jgi:hypothetical protein
VVVVEFDPTLATPGEDSPPPHAAAANPRAATTTASSAADRRVRRRLVGVGLIVGAVPFVSTALSSFGSRQLSRRLGQRRRQALNASLRSV